MKLFAARAAPAVDVASDEPDFPLPVADPSVPAMHRQCVLNGCSYRSGLLFAAGWVFAAVFLVAAAAICFYGVNAQEALLRENAVLIEALRDRTQPPAPPPSSARVETPRPPPASAPKPPDSASPPPKAPALPRRRSAVPKPEKEYRVPEEEKWWNRP
jgi:hypothetical protein